MNVVYHMEGAMHGGAVRFSSRFRDGHINRLDDGVISLMAQKS